VYKKRYFLWQKRAKYTEGNELTEKHVKAHAVVFTAQDMAKKIYSVNVKRK
jgi:hypothetical protein